MLVICMFQPNQTVCKHVLLFTSNSFQWREQMLLQGWNFLLLCLILQATLSQLGCWCCLFARDHDVLYPKRWESPRSVEGCGPNTRVDLQVSTTFLKTFYYVQWWEDMKQLPKITTWSYIDNCTWKQNETYNEWRWSTNINNILDMDAPNNNEMDGARYKHPCTLSTNDHVWEVGK
jgi:hypothetical protein